MTDYDDADARLRADSVVDLERDSLAKLPYDTLKDLAPVTMTGIASIMIAVVFLYIVSAIFIPLTFLAGIWGMNFDPASSPWNMPELLWPYGYPAALGFMALVAFSLVLFFRWRKWL